MDKLRNKTTDIHQEIKDTVSGYIKRNNIQYLNIPNGIIVMILLYYNDNFKFRVNTNDSNYAQNLQFINGRIVKQTDWNQNSAYSVCIIDTEINANICNSFELHIKWNTAVSGFYIGYFSSTTARYTMETMNRCVCVSKWERSFSTFSKFKHKGYISLEKFTEGDRFTILFDFNQNHYKIYHNNLFAVQEKLQHKSIIPAFALRYKHSEIEIIRASMK
eukprot:358481_1